jgi:hypothetical protein
VSGILPGCIAKSNLRTNRVNITDIMTTNSIYGIPVESWGYDKDYIKARLTQTSYVSTKHKYVYLEVPKAACTRLKYIIHTLEQLRPVPVTFDRLPETRLFMFIHDRERFEMPSLADFPEDEITRILAEDEYFKFTFVRNPYSRLVSAWMNKLYFIEPGLENLYHAIKNNFPDCVDGRYITFEGFVKYINEFENIRTCNPHYRLQSDLIMANAIEYDMVAKVEKFDEGIKQLETRIGVSNLDNSKSGSSNESYGEDWRSHYTPELADIVYKLYKNDFEQFEYTASSWKGGKKYCQKSPREIYLENQIFDRNRLISQMYQWINAKVNQ